jgi:hypothetical protein
LSFEVVSPKSDLLDPCLVGSARCAKPFAKLGRRTVGIGVGQPVFSTAVGWFLLLVGLRKGEFLRRLRETIDDRWIIRSCPRVIFPMQMVDGDFQMPARLRRICCTPYSTMQCNTCCIPIPVQLKKKGRTMHRTDHGNAKPLSPPFSLTPNPGLCYPSATAGSPSRFSCAVWSAVPVGQRLIFAEAYRYDSLYRCTEQSSLRKTLKRPANRLQRKAVTMGSPDPEFFPLILVITHT